MSSQNPVFIPGPTNIPERLRHACNVPTIDHRSASFGAIFRPLFPGVREVLKSRDAEIVLFPATGTAGWEAALTNTLSPGDRVLAARHGMFSHRWIDMGQRLGLDVEVIEAPWGAGAPVAAMGEALAADRDHRIKAVLVTHNETATGVRSDVAGVRKAMDAAGHPALLLVDGVSSIASMDFRMDEWGVDVAVTGSQKGFMLPAGLAIVGVSRKALAAMETARLPRCFLDFRDMIATNAKGGYPYTPPVNLLYGLGASLEMLREEGLPAVFARHRRIAEGIRRAVDAWGLRLCARTPDLYSDTVSAVVVPEGFDGTRVVTHAAVEIRRRLRRRPRRGRRPGLPHRPSRQPDRRHGALGPRDRRDGHGRPRFPDPAWQRRRGGAGLLPHHRRDRPARSRLRRSPMTVETATALDLPTYDDVLAAHARIKPWVHRTPILTSRFIDELAGASLYFKCENFQKAGAFKVRGACNAVFGLPDDKLARGVATHSSGNHALSLSYAAGRRGIPCHVVMPRTAPQAKKDAVRGYGGIITECEPSTSSREEVFARVQAETGADFVHPYNDPRVIAGQGTCSREIVEDLGPLDAVIAPIGGGGMISGTCLTLASVAPRTAIYAAEPEAADDAFQSFKQGRIVAYDAPVTVADGLKVPLKERTWHFVSRYVTDVLTASEEEIVDAMRLTWARLKIVIEPSSAVPLATILKNRDVFAGKRVGVVITGGNVDLDKLPWQN